MFHTVQVMKRSVARVAADGGDKGTECAHCFKEENVGAVEDGEALTAEELGDTED